MKQFSSQSLSKLQSCHPDLQRLFIEVVKQFDCTILEGHRNKADQDLAYASGRSKLKWPNGEHNSIPSTAVDVAPYPVDWNDIVRFYFFAGYVLGIANQLGIKIRWGGDWNSNTQVKDESFKDLVHFEIDK